MKHVKCVVVGDRSSGKAQYIIAYIGAPPGEDTQHVFDNYSGSIILPNGQLINLQIWDTAVGEEFKQCRKMSYPGTEVFIYFFKISDPVSFDDMESIYIPEAEEICPDIPAILVATYCELLDEPKKVDGRRGERIIEDDEVRRLMMRHPNIKDYFKCSLKNCKWVDAFETAAIVSFKGGIDYKRNFLIPEEFYEKRKSKLEELKNVRKFAVAIGAVGKVVRPSQTDYKLMIMNDFNDIVDIGRRASTLIIAFADREKLQDALGGIEATLRKQKEFESVILLHVYERDVFDGVTGLDVKQAIRRMGGSSRSVSYTKIEEGYEWEELRDVVLGERDGAESGTNSAQTNTECAIA